MTMLDLVNECLEQLAVVKEEAEAEENGKAARKEGKKDVSRQQGRQEGR